MMVENWPNSAGSCMQYAACTVCASQLPAISVDPRTMDTIPRDCNLYLIDVFYMQNSELIL